MSKNTLDLSSKRIIFFDERDKLKSIKKAMKASGAEIRSSRHVTSVDKLSTPVDGAVINANSFMGDRPFLDTTPINVWQACLQENFEHVIFTTQTVAKHMIAQKTPGRIIVVSTVAGLKPYRNFAMLGTINAALHAVIRIAAVDLAAYNITINIIAAGWGNISEITPTDLRGVSAIEANIPLRRTMWVDEDLGDLCCFLASDAASYITGTIIPVDGGYSITKAGASTIKRTE